MEFSLYYEIFKLREILIIKGFTGYSPGRPHGVIYV